MKQFLAILTALVLVAVAMVMISRMDRVPWSGPRSDVIRADEGVLYSIEYHDQRIAVLLPPTWDNCTSRTSTNTASGTLDADVDFFPSGGKSKLNIQFHSSSPGSILIDNQSFSVARGAVFYVKTDDAGLEVVEVTQAPFTPLAPSPEYLQKLKLELDR